MVCLLCEELTQDINIVKRCKNFTIIFNRYPYVPGHIMILSNEHIPNQLDKLTVDMRAELIEIMNIAQIVVMNATNTNSSNLGMNTGPVSGASIPEHFHMHIIPRRAGDSGFYGTIAKSVTMRENTKYRQSIVDEFVRQYDGQQTE